jgi:two-component system, OmpR family, KDP operon response regulator KdpE
MGCAMTDARTSHAALVLVIEDDRSMRRLLKAALENNGYRLVEAENGEEGLRQAATRSPDLVLLDLGLPDLDGLEVTRRLREWSAVPIIVLTARGQEADKIRTLDAGADDYVTKPFAVEELLARIRVAERHAAQRGDGEEAAEFHVDSLAIDFVRRRVTVDDREIHLTPIEYRLLTALAQFPGRILTHEQLLKKVWGPGYTQQHHYVRVYMAQLRHKLEHDPSRPRLLISEPGVGYRLSES